jgi:hypothetical protein
MVKRRSFPPSGGVGRSVAGSPFKALSQRYAWYKSGTYPYKSPWTKAAARARRSNPGPFGWGPVASNPADYRVRLGPRSSTPDQRLSDGTAMAVGVVRRDAHSATVGLRTEPARERAAHLQRRNAFWGISEAEKRELQAIARKAGLDAVRKLKFKSGTTRISLS